MPKYLGVFTFNDGQRPIVRLVEENDPHQAYSHIKDTMVGEGDNEDWQDIDRKGQLHIFHYDLAFEVESGVSELRHGDMVFQAPPRPIRRCTYRCTTCDRERDVVEAAVGFPEGNISNGACCTYGRGLLVKVERVVDPSWDTIKECYGKL